MAPSPRISARVARRRNRNLRQFQARVDRTLDAIAHDPSLSDRQANRLAREIEVVETDALDGHLTLSEAQQHIHEIYGDQSDNTTYYFERRHNQPDEGKAASLADIQRRTDRHYGDQSSHDDLYPGESWEDAANSEWSHQDQEAMAGPTQAMAPRDETSDKESYFAEEHYRLRSREFDEYDSSRQASCGCGKSDCECGPACDCKAKGSQTSREKRRQNWWDPNYGLEDDHSDRLEESYNWWEDHYPSGGAEQTDFEDDHLPRGHDQPLSERPMMDGDVLEDLDTSSQSDVSRWMDEGWDDPTSRRSSRWMDDDLESQYHVDNEVHTEGYYNDEVTEFPEHQENEMAHSRLPNGPDGDDRHQVTRPVDASGRQRRAHQHRRSASDDREVILQEFRSTAKDLGHFPDDQRVDTERGYEELPTVYLDSMQEIEAFRDAFHPYDVQYQSEGSQFLVYPQLS